MKKTLSLLGIMALGLMTACTAATVADDPATELVISQSWSGDYPVAELKRLPDGQQESRVGYLGNAAAFNAVWADFKPQETTPQVDFRKNMVVFSRNVDFYNRTRILKVMLKDGVAEVIAMETMSAIPIESKVAMAMAVIPRAHVQYIQTGQARLPVSTD
jgi:hypothetical protein